MKRYLLFAGNYYEGEIGGWQDFIDIFNTVEEAKAVGKARSEITGIKRYDWFHVVDIQTLTQVPL